MARSGDSAVPGVRDVARHANVSRGTVSNVINYPDRVSEKTRERVLQSIEALGFVPDGNARTLTVGHSDVVGLILPGLKSSFFVDVARGAQAIAQDAGFSLLIATSVSHNDDGAARQNGYLEYFDSTRARGILIAPASTPSAAVRRSQRRGRSIVTINFIDDELDACGVIVNEERAGYIAATELIEAGCRRLIWVGGQGEFQPVGRRYAGVVRAVEQAGTTVDVQVVDAGGLTPEHGDAVGLELAAQSAQVRPDGVVTASASLGTSIMKRLLAAGVRVPDQVKIASCEGNTDVITSDAPVTASEVSGDDVGRQAVELLLHESVSGDPAHEHRTVVIEPSLVRRSSTLPNPAN